MLKWWHRAPNGETGLGQRTKASDPHLWLPYVLDALCRRDRRRRRARRDRRLSRRAGGARRRRHLGDRAARLARERRRLRTLPPRDRLHVASSRRKRPAAARRRRLERRHRRPRPAGARHQRLDGLLLLRRADALHSARRSAKGDPAFAARCESARAGLARGARSRLAGDALRARLRRQRRAARHAQCDDDRLAALIPAPSIMRAASRRSRAASRASSAPIASCCSKSRSSNIRTPYPGRIADYPPGVRENGGQYSHGASWIIDGFVRLSEEARAAGDDAGAARLAGRAFTIFEKISPLKKTDPDNLARYGLAPNQQPADIYDGYGHDGRGGWSWYTGSAARMLSAAYALIGVKMVDGEIVDRAGIVRGEGRTAGRGAARRRARAASAGWGIAGGARRARRGGGGVGEVGEALALHSVMQQRRKRLAAVSASGSEAIQTRLPELSLDCFVASLPRNDVRARSAHAGLGEAHRRAAQFLGEFARRRGQRLAIAIIVSRGVLARRDQA